MRKNKDAVHESHPRSQQTEFRIGEIKVVFSHKLHDCRRQKN